MLNVQRSRPLGITIIAVIMAILGIIKIIGGIVLLAIVPALGIISIILGVLEFILAWGLWHLRTWAYWATVLLEALVVIQGVFGIARGTSVSIIDVVIAVILLIYLFADSNVRTAFRTI